MKWKEIGRPVHEILDTHGIHISQSMGASEEDSQKYRSVKETTDTHKKKEQTHYMAVTELPNTHRMVQSVKERNPRQRKNKHMKLDYSHKLCN